MYIMPQCFSSHNVSLHLCLFTLLISISLHLCLFFCSSLLLFFSSSLVFHFLSPLFSSLLFSRSSLLLIFSSSRLLVSCLIFFCLSLSSSLLSLSSSLLSLSSCRVFFLCLHSLSLSVSLCLSPSLSPCCVVRVVVAVVCVFGVCVSVCVWCVVCVCVCVLRQAEKTWKNRVCIQKRSHVCIQNVPVCTGTTRTCVETCARGAGKHGDFLNGHTGCMVVVSLAFFIEKTSKK